MQSNLDLFKLAEQRDIIIDTVKIPLNESMSVNYDGREFILLDEKVRTDSAEERVHLAHEIGHCLTGSYYAIGADQTVRKKAEKRAKTWSIVHLLPKDALSELLKKGYNEWDIAEELNITVDIVREAYSLYFDMCA